MALPSEIVGLAALRFGEAVFEAVKKHPEFDIDLPNQLFQQPETFNEIVKSVLKGFIDEIDSLVNDIFL